MGLVSPIAEGEIAPNFQFQVDGKMYSLSELQQTCLLYFYPKDSTPGCTKQACGIRDSWPEFENAGILVVGVSKDSESSHEKFREKYQLPFPLIADTEGALCQAYGVWGEKKFMGRVFNGIHRMSFLIGPDRRILKTYPKVKPDTHASQILEDAGALT